MLYVELYALIGEVFFKVWYKILDVISLHLTCSVTNSVKEAAFIDME